MFQLCSPQFDRERQFSGESIFSNSTFVHLYYQTYLLYRLVILQKSEIVIVCLVLQCIKSEFPLIVGYAILCSIQCPWSIKS